MWNTFPRSPETLEAAVRDMAALGYRKFETFAAVIEDLDKKGTLERLIAEHRIPLVSGYAVTNVINPDARKTKSPI